MKARRQSFVRRLNALYRLAVSSVLVVSLLIPSAISILGSVNNAYATTGSVTGSPGFCTSQLSATNTPWTNPNNARLSDNTMAEVSLKNTTSRYLICSSYTFAGLPAGSNIDGIIVNIERSSEGGNESSVVLKKAGGETSSDKSTGAVIPTSEAVIQYGGASDLWGTTWTYSDVTSYGFGVEFAATNPNGGPGRTTYVDAISITLHYTSSTITQSDFRFYNPSTNSIPGVPIANANEVAFVPSAPADPVPPSYFKVSAGSNYTCAVGTDGKGYCWGANDGGQLGNGTTTPSNIATSVSASGVLAGKTIQSISAGSSHTCAIASDNLAYCWGNNSNGQLGNETTTSSNIPVAVSTSGVLAGKTIKAITTGGNHSCAIASDNLVYCWGSNSDGQLGYGSTLDRSSPVAVTTSGALSGKTILKMSVAYNTSCAIASDNLAYCWGSNSNGQIGDGSFTMRPNAVAVTTTGDISGKTIKSIDVGGGHTCAVASDSHAYCWGNNIVGQLGNGLSGVNGTRSVPVAVITSGVLAGQTITDISAGGTHSCVTTQTGEAFCWGQASSGELGNNSYNWSSHPVTVTTTGAIEGQSLVKVSLGSIHSCASTSNQTTYCWGSSNSGQVGHGVTTNSVGTPVATKLLFYDAVSSVNSLRMRLALTVASAPISLLGSVNLSLQYATKSAATCSVQTSGFSNVTNTTPIAWHVIEQPSNGAVAGIYTGEEPTSSDIVYQRIVTSQGTFNNRTTATIGQHMLWDFALKNISESPGTSYCLRAVNVDGSELSGGYSQFPEIMTIQSSVSVAFVDRSTNQVVVTPSYTLPSANYLSTCQESYAEAIVSPDPVIRVTQTGAMSGWSVSISPTGGQSALWHDSTNELYYDFNDSSGSPAGCSDGSDGDSYAGQLILTHAGASSLPQPKSGCSATGISTGVQASFESGVVDAITIAQGSSSTQANCYWDFEGFEVSQTIPAYQPPGNYTLDLTITAVAS